MILVTSYYHTPHQQRQEEINTCLQKNCDHEAIHRIILLNDTLYPLDFLKEGSEEKIEQHLVDRQGRLYYRDAVAYINEFLIGEIIILVNSDIYMDRSLFRLYDYDFSNTFLALSRYEHNNIALGHISSCSQDTWIFQSPLRVDLSLIDFPFGMAGCDNRLARIIHDAGYRVLNPCRSIITYHMHSSRYRTYNQSVDIVRGPYMDVEACYL